MLYRMGVTRVSVSPRAAPCMGTYKSKKFDEKVYNKIQQLCGHTPYGREGSDKEAPGTVRVSMTFVANLLRCG